MFKKNLITRTLRNAALVGLVGSLAYPVLAQETPVDEESVEKIKVTGSRIKRTELSTPAPIVSVSAEEIKRFGTPDLGSILAELDCCIIPLLISIMCSGISDELE